MVKGGDKTLRKRRYFTLSYFCCEDCGNKLTVPRMVSSSRPKGHVKDLWCPFCKEVKKMREVRECDHVRNALGEPL